MRQFSFIFLAFVLSQSVFSGPREQAYRLHNRLTGVPPIAGTLDQMQFLIQNSDPESAARMAMNNPRFYNLVLKNWIKRWSNVDQTNRVPLNDYVATVIGMIRDDLPFDQILYADILYTSNDTTVAPYSIENNDHFEELEASGANLFADLTQRIQSQINGISDTAGVLTTRAAGEAFYSAGTNRRVLRFAFMNFLCRDYEALHDITRPDIYVRRDVDRKPGNDSRTYKNKCVGCHAGQDALAGALAYFDWDGDKLVYTQGTVATKINQNNLFDDGHVVQNDGWMNYWNQGQNAVLGWRGPQAGTGLRSLGRMLSQSQAFSQCMAERAFKLVCLKDPVRAEDIASVNNLAAQFEAQNRYNMKDLIAKTSVLCLGE